MNAIQALIAAKNNKPKVENDKYDSIMASIKWASERGQDHVNIGFRCPDEKTMERLKSEGYKFYSFGDNWMFPKTYGISWAEEQPKKKKWYQKIFS